MDNEMTHLIWNFVLTAGAAGVGWWVINMHNELKRVEILLNRTREEVARDYIQNYVL